MFVLMSRKQKHIKYLKHILLMLFFVFSLSPCTVKQTLFDLVNTDYTKPLNKLRTSVSTSSCFYWQNDCKQTCAVKKSKVYNDINSINLYFVVLSTKAYRTYADTFSGNSPPIYILYKRLKIDIA